LVLVAIGLGLSLLLDSASLAFSLLLDSVKSSRLGLQPVLLSRGCAEEWDVQKSGVGWFVGVLRNSMLTAVWEMIQCK
jgi:hypothetical protein